MNNATLSKPARASSRGRWNAVLRHDRSQDGRFYYAVASTGIYCKPSCPSRRPARDKVVFFNRPAQAEAAGFRPCRRCHPRDADSKGDTAAAVQRICRYLERNLDETVDLPTLGREAGMSPFHLQRLFKAALGVSPREYAARKKLERFKHGLKAGHSVTRSMYDAGYNSSSRLYERAQENLGMTPGLYRRAGQGLAIDYAITRTSFGLLLVAATEKGVCFIALDDSASRLERELKDEFPHARFKRAPSRLRPWISLVQEQLRGGAPTANLPLDIAATAFQARVWKYLSAIPSGTTQSYAEVAKKMGQPRSFRAVARACATNPVAIAIPCHRVVRSDGNLSGYRWGIDRKRALLDREKSGG
jgi:AraC family transcriptional regulator, regulatory protein of adaptative response / methylated-DNA-[protein]-cysteine methyltransferase